MRVLYLILMLGSSLSAQVTIQGHIYDAKQGSRIANALVLDSLDPNFKAISDVQGEFSLSLPQAQTHEPRSLLVIHDEFKSQYVRIRPEDMSGILAIAMQWEIPVSEPWHLTLNLSDDDGYTDQVDISPPLNAYGDPLDQAERYDFSVAFYRPFGAKREQQDVIFQGLSLKNPFTGIVQWNILTGLNQSMKQAESQNHFLPSAGSFGELGGVTNVEIRPAMLRPGTRFKTQISNGHYTWGFSLNQVMSERNGWHSILLLSARDGQSGMIRGNRYYSRSGLVGIEKQFKEGSAIGMLLAFAPSLRGMSAPLTPEVMRLKGTSYNPNWGWYQDQWRNSRERKSEMPMFVLSYYRPSKGRSQWKAHWGLIAGSFGQSRLNYSSSMSPFKNHYSLLPSYFLRNDVPLSYDYLRAFEAQNQFVMDGQIDWEMLYQANINSPTGMSKYLIQQEINKRIEQQLRWQYEIELNPNNAFVFMAHIRNQSEERWAEIADLLGGSHYIDRNNFYDGPEELGQWNNADRLDTPIYLGDKLGHHYTLFSESIELFGQYQYSYRLGEIVLSGQWRKDKRHRIGHMRNGVFSRQGESQGRSRIARTHTLSGKIHWAHYWTPRWSSDFTLVISQKPPEIRQSYALEKYHNQHIQVSQLPLFMGLFSRIRSQGSGYDLVFKPFVYRQLYDRQSRFYYSDYILASSSQSGLVQEHLSNLDLVGLGWRIGMSLDLGGRIKLKGIHVLTDYVYLNDAKLFLAGTNFSSSETSGSPEPTDLNRFGSRRVFLSNRHARSGPEQVVQASLMYRDPTNWWTEISWTHFKDRYVNMSHLRRSVDALTQFPRETNVIQDPTELRDLWRQEKLPNFSLIQLKIGASWRIQDAYLSLFGSIQNLLNLSFYSGGFESSRPAHIHQLISDNNRPHGPLFGNKYFAGRGRNYYLTFSINF